MPGLATPARAFQAALQAHCQSLTQREVVTMPNANTAQGRAIFILAICAITYYVIKVIKSKSWIENAEDRQQKRFDYLNPHTQKAKEKQWTSEGWRWDEEKGEWVAPYHLRVKEKIQWVWDEEKQVWVEKERKERMERYRKYREGKEPTYEEWKAAREKERQEQAKSKD